MSHCGMCGSTDLWDDNLNGGCNKCGAMYLSETGWFYFGEPKRKKPLKIKGEVVTRSEHSNRVPQARRHAWKYKFTNRYIDNNGETWIQVD
jgi:hypothetical protein